MPITPSAKKALRVSKRKYLVNQRVRSQMKTAVKKFMATPSAETLAEAYRRIDRAVKNNLLHRNTAARRKSNLSKRLDASSK